jgi:hypothetical protein
MLRLTSFHLQPKARMLSLWCRSAGFSFSNFCTDESFIRNRSFMPDSHLHIYLGHPVAHLSGTSSCTFILDINLHIYLGHPVAHLSWTSTCTFIRDIHFHIYLGHPLTHLSGTSTCTFIWDIHLHIYLVQNSASICICCYTVVWKLRVLSLTLIVISTLLITLLQ